MHPEDKDAPLDYPKHQLWLFMEMSDAGVDLGKLLVSGFPDGKFLHKRQDGQRLTMEQCWDIFWGVAEALRNGEQYAKFEHRDLHPGNLCVKRVGQARNTAPQLPKKKHPRQTDSKGDASAQQGSAQRIAFHAPDSRVKYTNLEVTIIDYTFSRVEIEGGNVLAFQQGEGIVGQKGANWLDQHQYDTYGLMRELIIEPASDNAEMPECAAWKQYVPQTNIMWLHHLLTVMFKHTFLTPKTPPGKSSESYGSWTKQQKYDYNLGTLLRGAICDLKKNLDPVRRGHCDWKSATELAVDWSWFWDQGRAALERDLEVRG